MGANTSKSVEQIIMRHRHLPPGLLAEKIETELGLEEQHDTREVRERDGMSLTTTKYRPHRRYITEWERID